eukprot:6200384-Pleurochrysis_carterae.AAC.14
MTRQSPLDSMTAACMKYGQRVASFRAVGLFPNGIELHPFYVSWARPWIVGEMHNHGSRSGRPQFGRLTALQSR